MKPRYLSKSRFKEAWECPTRLFYVNKPGYGTTTADDSFLKSLADGGFQVGSLARQYYPHGILVETMDVEIALRETAEHMRKENVVLFEGAVAHGNLLARVDLIVKEGQNVKLIEVKSKSIDGSEDTFFQKAKKNKQRALDAKWVPYVADVAFQQIVFQRAYANCVVTPFLMLADKSRPATVDGLHQRFLLERQGRTTLVHVAPGSVGDALGERILSAFDVTDAIHALEAMVQAEDGTTFVQRIDRFASAYAGDTKLPPMLDTCCRECPYRIDDEMKRAGLNSGFDECWSQVTGLSSDELSRPLVVDMGRLDVQRLVETSHFLLEHVEESEIKPRPGENDGLSFSQRRWLQIEKLKNGDRAAYFDADGMRAAYERFVYPLHMIDFETMRAAVPFHKGSRPYAQLAFQFSHHVVREDGVVEHAGEYLAAEPGAFPNYEFARALRAALSNDNGTVFRYAAHENTVLCDIIRQLEEDESPPKDRDDLIAWIRTITHGPKDAEDTWCGARDMVDMLELVKRFYYHPATKGSNSIKYVLPAALEESQYLRRKYQEPIYGAPGGIKSQNFVNQVWVQMKDGKVQNPYKLLPHLFDNSEDEATIERLYADDEIREGGAAMTAFARMQFTQMHAIERRKISDALLKYCELDTFAMVLLFEHWKNLLGM